MTVSPHSRGCPVTAPLPAGTPVRLVATPPSGLPDRHGRTINYLRVSLTDMCNLRCVYCMPADMTFRPPASDCR